MQKKEVFTVEQLSFISKLLTWGSIAGGFLLWLCTPWSVPIYHTGMRYYEGSKLPLLLIVALPFLIFIQGKPEIELHSKSRRETLMNNLTAKHYTLIRNIIMVAGIILAFLLWLYIPSLIENNPLIHVGNGKYGSKLGLLLLLLIPFFGLIPKNPYEEVHTEDIEERVKIENEQKIESEKYQITITIACSLVACFCMILAIILG